MIYSRPLTPSRKIGTRNAQAVGFNVDHNSVCCIIHKAHVNEPVKINLSVLQAAILKEIERNRDVSYDNLAKILKRSRSTIMRNISTLKDAGYLRRVGPDKTGKWVIPGKHKG
jgi:predicted HTH transcriptional regulator